MEKLDKKSIEEAVKTAQEASASADPSLREKAFEIVLLRLLGTGSDIMKEELGSVKSPAVAPYGKSAPLKHLDLTRIVSQLGISKEQADQLYEFKDDLIHLGIKPIGVKLSDKQRNLAHALLVGYRLGLDRKEVSISELSKVAEEWNILDKNFGRSINDKNVQMKGVGRGKRPTISLAPGAIERLKDEIISMLE